MVLVEGFAYLEFMEWSGFNSEVSMTCLLSCSEERLTVKSKHLALKGLLMKVLCWKMKGTQYIISQILKRGPIKRALQVCVKV